MRTASPPIVTRALSRTVVFVSAALAAVCCDVPQAVSQRVDGGLCARPATGEPKVAASARTTITARVASSDA